MAQAWMRTEIDTEDPDTYLGFSRRPCARAVTTTRRAAPRRSRRGLVGW